MKKLPLGWIFLLLFLAIAIPLFTLPINLFPGVILYKNGISEYSVDHVNLSLSYFIGLGLNPGDLDDVQTFYLTPWGYALAACYLVLLPSVVTYRVYLKRRKAS
ncbi:MAG: hypothetical protein EBS17_08800 [Flavobacteriia bacterium]|nr:hypothetical protein [Flavobacteriia bacterium]